MHTQDTQDERVTAALAYEARTLGRECFLIDAAILAEDVIAIVYSTAPFRHGDDESREIRTATRVGGQPKYSTIVSTAWSRAQSS